MRSRLRFFAAVGVVATLIDLVIFVRLDELRLWLADLFALTAAAVFSYLGNRWITFRGDRDARWVSQPGLFAVTALGAGVVDFAVLSLTIGIVADSRWLAKLVAISTAAMVRWVSYRLILFNRVRRDLAQRVPRPPADATYRLSVVLPAYNESVRIGTTIEAIAAHCTEAIGAGSFEIVVVDDGSTDDTAAHAAAAGARVLQQPVNAGKGAAVRAGVLAADGATVIFTDADLAYAPELLITLLEGVEDGWDMVVGSRRHSDSDALVHAKRIREFGGAMVNRLTHLVLLGHFRDTQCGLKGFRGDIGRVIFERTNIDGFAFDVELFLIAEQDQLSLLEVPVVVANRAGSSVSLFRDTADLLVDLVRIRRWAGAGRYRPTDSQTRVMEARAGDPQSG